MERDINLEILLMGLLGWCTGDWNWTGGVRYPPPLLLLLAGDPGLLLGVLFGFPTTPMVTPMGVCQEDDDISLSGLLSKLFRTLQMPMLPSLEPVKTWLLLVVIVLMVELWAFISPSKAQVSTDHSLMKPDLQIRHNSRMSMDSHKRDAIHLNFTCIQKQLYGLQEGNSIRKSNLCAHCSMTWHARWSSNSTS